MALQLTDSRFVLCIDRELATFEYRVLDPGIWPRRVVCQRMIGVTRPRDGRS